jgi:uncharacterized protein with FMN-binding domain
MNSSSSTAPASLARRALPALVLAGGTVAFVAALDQPGEGLVVTAPAGSVATPATAVPPTTLRSGTSTPTVPANTVPATPAPAPGGREGRQRDSEGTPGATVPAPSTPATPNTALDLASCADPTTITGGAVQSRFGPFQAQVTVAADGHICAVEALQQPTDRRSLSINTNAIPTFHDRVIAAQGTKVQAISGATVTYQSYLASIQSALDAR